LQPELTVLHANGMPIYLNALKSSNFDIMKRDKYMQKMYLLGAGNLLPRGFIEKLVWQKNAAFPT
jgi:hypothetical protein